ncbi:MAG: hypothetical protein OEW19_19095, partial [Acidobacteriota bacterium]|nr:hypothetical protein [Acidobacteriota bacterium]
MPEADLARDATPDGKELVLYRRDGVYSLRVDGLELMSSRAHASEEALTRLACQGLESASSPRVLVGGLGFGYTLRATLDRLPDGANVVVAEVFASLLDWNRELLADLAGRPLEDRRVDAVHGDVWDLVDQSAPFDAIILDVDNGPWALTVESNARLYSGAGLARLAGGLKNPGRLAVWSAGAAPR